MNKLLFFLPRVIETREATTKSGLVLPGQKNVASAKKLWEARKKIP